VFLRSNKLLRHGTGTHYCDERVYLWIGRLFLCLSVHEHITRVTRGSGLVSLWRHSDFPISYVLLLLWMTSPSALAI